MEHVLCPITALLLPAMEEEVVATSEAGPAQLYQAMWCSSMGFWCQLNVQVAISVSHTAWDEVTVC